MKAYKAPPFLLVLATLLLAACGPGAEAAIATGIAQTQQISALETAAAGGGDAPAEVGQAADTPGPSADIEVATQPVGSLPTNTPTPSKTPTPTQTQTEEVHIRAELGQRQGNCGASNTVTFEALITVNQPVKISYWWEFNNGNHTTKETLEFTEEGNKYVSAEFPLAFNGWVRLYIGSPLQIYSNKVNFHCQSSFDWSGTWIIYTPYFTTSPVPLVVNQSGSSISGLKAGSNSGSTYTFSGSLSADNHVVTGTFTSNSGDATGTFVWQINSSNQFVGHLVPSASSTSREFCGSRAGAPMPNPCYGP